MTNPILRASSRRACIVGALVLSLVLPGARQAVSAPRGARSPWNAPVGTKQQVSDPFWLLVNPERPSVLLASVPLGTSADSPAPNGTTILMYRSADSGATWTSIRVNLPLGDSTDYWTWTAGNPPVFSRDGRHLLLLLYKKGITAGSSYPAVAASRDGGLHWTLIDDGSDYGYGGYGAGPYALAFSPIALRRAYEAAYYYNSAETETLSSQDAGQSWSHGGFLSENKALDLGQAPNGAATLVADPVSATTVYANIEMGDLGTYYDGKSRGPSAFVARSDDAGHTWTTALTPTVSPALQTFRVSTDPLLPGLLIGQTDDKNVPAATRYFTHDSGHTWTTGTCPGDLTGTCPSFTVGPVFGAGSSYAFVAGGIYAFQGTGPSTPGQALSISDRLPLPLDQIDAVQAGSHPGDPVYLLSQGRLYRSADAGQSWLAPPLVTPAGAAPSAGHGARFFARTHHNLSGPFLAFWRAYGGLDAFGYPRTEPFTENGRLVQYTDRFLLELVNGRVQTGPLGRLLTVGRTFARLTPFSSTPRRLYVARTGHSLSGDFLTWW